MLPVDPRGDDGLCRRARAPALGLDLDQPVATRGGVDAAFLGEDAQPALGDDLEEIERPLPVGGEALGHQLGEPVEGQALGVHAVEEAAELGAKVGGLGLVHRGAPAMRAAPGVEGGDEPAQQELAAYRRHRRRKVEAVGGRFALGPGQGDLGFIDVADWAHRRQQRGLAAALAKEGIGQRAAGAAVGQEHRDRAQSEHRRAVAAHDLGGQRIEERGAGGHGEYAGARHRT